MLHIGAAEDDHQDGWGNTNGREPTNINFSKLLGTTCNVVTFYRLFREKMLNPQNSVFIPQEREDTMMEYVVSVGYLKEFNLGPIQISVEFMRFFPKSIVRSQTFTLMKMKPNIGNVLPSMASS